MASQHVVDDLAQRQAARRFAHRVDQRREGGQVGARLARHRADALPAGCLPLARAASCSCSMRARADAARREIDDAQEARVVVRVLDQAQVGERVLDLGALEEAQAAVDACTACAALKSALSITRLCALLR